MTDPIIAQPDLLQQLLTGAGGGGGTLLFYLIINRILGKKENGSNEEIKEIKSELTKVKEKVWNIDSSLITLNTSTPLHFNALTKQIDELASNIKTIDTNYGKLKQEHDRNMAKCKTG